MINEDEIFSFKFWFNDTIQYGMFYKNELYCRLKTFDIQARPQAYQLGCRLARQNAVVVLTCSPTACSLWGCLRSPLVKEVLLCPASLDNQGLEFLLAPDKASTEQPEC
jgi:hypothetical protein